MSAALLLSGNYCACWDCSTPPEISVSKMLLMAGSQSLVIIFLTPCWKERMCFGWKLICLFLLFFFSFSFFRNFVQNKACKGHFPLNMKTFHYFWHIMILSILSTFIILLDFSFKTAFFSVFPLDIRHILVSLDSPLRFVLSVTCIVCVLRALLHLRTCWGDSQGKSNLSRHINLFFPCPCSSGGKLTETTH